MYIIRHWFDDQIYVPKWCILFQRWGIIKIIQLKNNKILLIYNNLTTLQRAVIINNDIASEISYRFLKFLPIELIISTPQFSLKFVGREILVLILSKSEFEMMVIIRCLNDIMTSLWWKPIVWCIMICSLHLHSYGSITGTFCQNIVKVFICILHDNHFKELKLCLISFRLVMLWLKVTRRG